MALDLRLAADAAELSSDDLGRGALALDTAAGGLLGRGSLILALHHSLLGV